jgi:hypothetical protein
VQRLTHNRWYLFEVNDCLLHRLKFCKRALLILYGIGLFNIYYAVRQNTILINTKDSGKNYTKKTDSKINFALLSVRE